MIGRILALAIGLMAGLAASQGPEFAQQYRQRLGGAIDELRRVTTRFDSDAQASGLSRDAAITRLREQAEPVARAQGDAMEQVGDRLAALETQRDAFADAGPFSRLFVMMHHVDPGLARATYLEFEPAWPATTEGLATGGAGFVAGWLAIWFLARTLARSWGRLVPGRRRVARSRLRSA